MTARVRLPTAEQRERAQCQQFAWVAWRDAAPVVAGVRPAWLGGLIRLEAWGLALRWARYARHPHDKALTGCVVARLDGADGRLAGVLRLFDPRECAARGLMPVMGLGTLKGNAVRMKVGTSPPESLVIADGIWAAARLRRELNPCWSLWAAPGSALGFPPAQVAVPDGRFGSVLRL